MQLAFKTILFATDFSQASELPLEYARSLAARFGSKLFVLHVLDEPFPVGSEMYVGELPESRARRSQAAQLLLAKIMATVSDIDVTSDVVFGNAARQIVNAAEQHDCDLIVMGTHGRGMVAHLFMGSVAERVVRTAHCPVLTVRSTQVEPVIETARATTVSA